MLVDAKSDDANWPLANKSPSGNFEFLVADAGLDKRVAAYLLVSGIFLGEFSTETLKQVDWQSRCEAVEEENEKLTETNGAQAQKIDEQAQTIDKQAQTNSAFEAKLSALKLRRPNPTAKL